jgi:hypothetical protein
VNSSPLVELRPSAGSSFEAVGEAVNRLIADHNIVSDLVRKDPRFVDVAHQLDQYGIDIRPFDQEQMSAISSTELKTRARLFKTSLFNIKFKDAIGLSIKDKVFQAFLLRENSLMFDNRWSILSEDVVRGTLCEEVTNRYRLVRGPIINALLTAGPIEDVDSLPAEAKLQYASSLELLKGEAGSISKMVDEWLTNNESRVSHWKSLSEKAVLHKEEVDRFTMLARNAYNSKGRIIPKPLREAIESSKSFSDLIKGTNGRVTHDRHSIVLRERQAEIMEELGDNASIAERRQASLAALISDHLEYTVGHIFGLAAGVASNISATSMKSHFDPVEKLQRVKGPATMKAINTAFGQCLAALAQNSKYQSYVLELLEDGAMKEHHLNFEVSNSVVEGKPLADWISGVFAEKIIEMGRDGKLDLVSFPSKIGSETAYSHVASRAAGIHNQNYWTEKLTVFDMDMSRELKRHFGALPDADHFELYLNANAPSLSP